MTTHEMVQALHRTLVLHGRVDIDQAAQLMGVASERVMGLLERIRDAVGPVLIIKGGVAQWRRLK